MLFKNLTAYRFTKAWRISLGELEAGVAKTPSRDCQLQELEHCGFDHIHDKTRLRVWPIRNEKIFLLKVTQTKRLLPPAIIKEEARKVIAKREKESGEPIKGAEKKEIINQVKDTLLQKAFQKKSVIQIVINQEAQEVWVDQVSEKKCDMALSLLRRAVGSLPVQSVAGSGEIVEQLSSWLLDESNCPAGIEIGDTAKLVDSADARAHVTIKRQDLNTDQIRALLDDRQVVSLGIEIGDHLSAELTSRRCLKSIKPKNDFDLGVNEGEDENTAFDALAHMSIEELVFAREKLKAGLPELNAVTEEDSE